MPGIPSDPPDLHYRLRNALLECEQFKSNDKLISVFNSYEYLRPWRFRVPQANNIASRVDNVIGFLVNETHSNSQNALVLLLRSLSNLIDKDDQRHQQLADLAVELKNALESTSTRSQPQPTNQPEKNFRGNPVPNKDQAPILAPIKNRWAFLVGVNRYIDPNFRRLNFCVDDVLVLAEKLKALNYIVVCLHDRSERPNRFPTCNNVVAELIEFCKNVKPDDLLLVHFACHGKRVNDKPVLILNDTRLPILETTGLFLEEVQQHMGYNSKAKQHMGAKRLVLTLDACHMGVETGRDVDDPEFIRNAYELAEGFALIAASTAQQKAQEWHGKKHGVFTYYLLEALEGKADMGNKKFVTVDDVKTYVLDKLKRWSAENSGIIQEPTAYTEGLGAMILADYRTTPATPGST
ncbi:caspase family protein [Nostoc sp. UHCC 0702]|nr:caspase family protein [Nostoc sp. UHCC 0702]